MIPVPDHRPDVEPVEVAPVPSIITGQVIYGCPPHNSPTLKVAGGHVFIGGEPELNEEQIQWLIDVLPVALRDARNQERKALDS